MADFENESLEEVKSDAVAEEGNAVKGTAIGKIRDILPKFFWVFSIVYAVLTAVMVYVFGQNLLTVFDYSLNAKTIENVALNIQIIFENSTPEMIMTTVFFVIITVIFAVFSVINVIRVIVFVISTFGLISGKDEEKRLKRFGKISRSFLASYALYFELLLLARMGDYNIGKGGRPVMIITCVAYFVLAIIWQLVSAENKDAFDWKKECFTLLRTLLRPTLALLLAIYAIPSWLKWLIDLVIATDSSGLTKDMMIPTIVGSVLGLAITINLAVTVRKTFKNGAITINGKNPKKTADRILFSGALVFMIFAIIRTAGMSLGGVLTGGGFDSATFIAEIKELLIPFMIFLSIIALTKVAATKE